MSLARITLVALSLGAWSSAAFAQSQYNGPATSTDTVRSRLPADGAVKADPGPKPSMVGHPATEFHPAVKTTPAAAPPSPVVSAPAKKSN
jgi:hypothetical protein